MKHRRGREVQALRAGSSWAADIICCPGALFCCVEKPPEGGCIREEMSQNTKPWQSRGLVPYDRFQFSPLPQRR